MIQRIISESPSVSDAYFAIDYASKQGMELDVNGYVNLIGKLVQCGRMAFNYNHFFGGGMSTDVVLLNTMVTCFCQLGKFEEARSHFHRIIKLGSIPCEIACNLLLRELLAKMMVLEAFNYFSYITGAGFHMDIWYYNMLVDKLCSKGHIAEAVEVIDMMQQAGIPPTLRQLKLVFYGLCKRGRVIQAELLSTVMESCGFFVDKVMYTSLICRYGRERKMKMATRVFFRMLKTGCEPDTFTFNTMINGFLKLGLRRECYWMYNKMIDLGNEPNAVTNHIMIRNLCREGNLVEAENVLYDIVKMSVVPLVHSYTTLISLLYKENKLANVERLWKSMLDQGILPDHLFYFTIARKHQGEDKLLLAVRMLLSIFEKEGYSKPHYPRAMELLDFFLVTKKFGACMGILLDEIATDSPHLATNAYGISICACCEIGHLPAARYLIDKMEANGFQPLLFTYNCMIKCLCEHGLFEYAKSIICLIQDKGLIPDVHTFLIMVNEYCKHDRLEKAKYAVSEMVEMGLKPNVAIYDTLIHFLGMRKRVSEAEDLFKQMLEEGNDPDEVIFMTMINVYMKSGRRKESIELFEQMKNYYFIQPTSYSYNAFIGGLLKKNKTGEAYSYLRKMIRDGFTPNKVLYTSLINYFSKKGAFGIAFWVADLMKRMEIDDLVTYIVLNRDVVRYVKVDEERWFSVNPRSTAESRMLLSSLEPKNYVPQESSLRNRYSPEELKRKFMSYQIEANKFMPNLYLLNCRISLLCKAQEMDEAYDCIEMMEKESLYPNQVTYTILMAGHISHGDICHAVDVFNIMNANGYGPDQVAYNTLLKGFCFSGMFQHALSISCLLHKKGLFPSKSSYKILLRQLCSFDMTDYAFKTFNDMISHGYRTDRFSCTFLHHNLCRDGMMREAEVVSDFLLTFKNLTVDEVRLNQQSSRLMRYNLSRHI